MPGNTEMTVCDKLLVAAFRLEQSGKIPFTAEDLVVAAWREFPATFGLRGYLDERGRPVYPDSNRVFAEIMGSKPIRKRGLLEKVGRKMYSLTESGRDLALHLDPGTETGQVKLAIDRELLRMLRRLLSTRAVEKVAGDEIDKLSFHDACIFWGITPQSSAQALMTQQANTKGVIEGARRAIKEGPGRLDHGGDLLSSEQVDLLERTHEALADRFQSEISTIMKRSDERKT